MFSGHPFISLENNGGVNAGAGGADGAVSTGLRSLKLYCIISSLSRNVSTGPGLDDDGDDDSGSAGRAVGVSVGGTFAADPTDENASLAA